MSAVVSDKLKKQIIGFFEWVELCNYTVMKNDIDHEWSLNLAPEYKEPGRNKLTVFIEEILKNHNINLDGTNIIDAKQMTSNFKNYKPVKEKKTSPKKSPVKKDKSPSKVKKSTKEEPRESTTPLVNDQSLDTSCNGMLCELEFTTKELENIFNCKPTFTGNEFSDHRYEWKFIFNDTVYSIYDWRYDDNTFDEYIDNDWFLGGDSENEDTIQLIKNLLNEKLLGTKSEAFVYDSEDEVNEVNEENVLVL